MFIHDWVLPHGAAGTLWVREQNFARFREKHLLVGVFQQIVDYHHLIRQILS